ncbi:MAG: ZIP family metal transporter [Steroidobacteraceae bacterium]
MSILSWVILFTVGSGAFSALAAGLFLLLPEHRRQRVLPHLVSFATGALLGAALLGLIPHAIEGAGVENTHGIGLALLGGILVFFVLEKLVLWRHCHHDEWDVHPHDAHTHGPTHQQRDAASASLILIGDGFHNALDGVLIAAAFLTDVHLGVVSAIAVFAHEIPQEVGDLAILLQGGMSRARALMLNLLTSLTSVVGGIVGVFALGSVLEYLPYALAIAASSFLYVAVADLIPGLHRKVDIASAIQQFVLISIGVALIYFTHAAAH